MINIIMIRRGHCPFTKLVHVARKKGAHAVIIVDREDSELTAKDMHRVILADDGSGEDIDIPSIVISKEDGARLIDTAKQEPVVVELNWDVPQADVVSMDLWMSSASKRSMQFAKDFSERRKTLNEVLAFQPHYNVISLPPATAGASVSDFASRNCVDSAGLYCAEAPELDGHISGKDVLEEDVRQLCIHEFSKVPRASKVKHAVTGVALADYAEKYWDYVEKFGERCPISTGRDAAHSFGAPCSEALMNDVGLDAKAVLDCAQRTGKDKLQYQRDHSAWSPHAVRINGWRYSGKLDADLVTRAACGGFIRKPAECQELIENRELDGIVIGMSGHPKIKAASEFFGTFIAFCVAGFALLMLYRQSRRSKIEEGSKFAVNGYSEMLG
jgi:hypothetical protein